MGAARTVESLLQSTHSSGPALNHLQMYQLLTLLISQAWSKPESYKDQSKHTQRPFQPSSAETTLTNPARQPIVACFCAKTNIWQLKTEEQSAVKSPESSKDVGDILDVDVWATRVA